MAKHDNLYTSGYGDDRLSPISSHHILPYHPMEKSIMNNETTTTKSNSTPTTISIEYKHISELSTHFGAGAFSTGLMGMISLPTSYYIFTHDHPYVSMALLAWSLACIMVCALTTVICSGLNKITEMILKQMYSF